MIDFEDAVAKIQKAEGLERGEAVARLHEAYENNDPQISKIKDLGSALTYERIKSVGENFGAGVIKGTVEFPEYLVNKLPGGEALTQPVEKMLSDIQSSVEPTKYAEGAGEMVGVGQAYGAPWEVAEGELARVAPVIPPLFRRAIVGAGLAKVTGGDPKVGAAFGAGVPLAAKLLGAVGGVVAEKLGTIFNRGSEDIEPEFSHVKPEAEPAAPTSQVEAKPEPVQETPISKPPTSTSGETPPWNPPSPASVQNPIAKISPDEEYVGTRDVTTGQPFTGSKTVRLSPGLYVNPHNINATLGVPAPVIFKKPMVVKFENEPYRDAIAKVFPNSPKLLDLYDKSATPIDTAREVLGRYARSHGYDGLILKHDDMSKDILLDFKDFKKDKGALTEAQAENVKGAKPPKTIFARPAEPAATLPSEQPNVVARYDLSASASLAQAAQAHGFPSVKALSTAVQVARYTPFEMLQHSAKALTEPPPLVYGGLQEIGSKSKGDVRAAIQAVANRYPRLMNSVYHFKMVHAPQEDWLAQTGDFGPKGEIGVQINTAFLPDTPEGKQMLQKFGFKPGEEKEFIATTIEHELTHVTQHFISARGLHQTFGSAKMPLIGEEEDPRIEAQAQNRDRALQSFFEQHKALQSRVAQVPPELRIAALKQVISDGRAQIKPRVLRKYNQLRGTHSVQYLARKKPDFTLEDMDNFDDGSRGGPLDSTVVPDKYFTPEVRQFLNTMQRAGMKWGLKGQLRLPEDVSDNEEHLYFHGRVALIAHDMLVTKDRFNARLGKILKEYDAKDDNYDHLWEVVEGLKRAPDGSLSESVPAKDVKTSKAARDIRERIFDPAYEHVTGISRKAPAILAEKGLKDTPKQWMRLKLLQMGQRGLVKDPTLDEFEAARKTEGMLNFDESHDLRTQYIDGYITHQPIANERTELLNQIDQVDKLEKLTGIKDDDGQALRIKRVQRLQEIEVNLAKAYLKSGPRTDVLPKKHYFGPALIKDNPASAEVLVDKHIPTIAGRYVNGIVTKRFFDQVLHEFKKVQGDMPGSVREYNTNFINNLRGLRGFKEDTGLVNFTNEMNKLLKNEYRVSLNDIRKAGEFTMQLQTAFKLLFGIVRFPAVQMTHVSMTTWPAAGTRSFLKGMTHFFKQPKSAVLQVMARGLIEHDAEFLAAIDGATPTERGNILEVLQWLPRYTDYFRKGVTWHTFRLKALEPGFKPDMSLARTFIKDVPGRGTIQTANEYADAMTRATQFELRAHGKPAVAVGGQGRRSVFQFKPWMVNYGTFYKNMLKSKDPAKISRLLAALYFVGGPTAVLGGDILYNLARNELLKHGYILPKDTGFQQVVNGLGWGAYVGDMDILSLRSPVGLPSDPTHVIPWLAGPMIGTLYDVGMAAYNDAGDTGKMFKDTISAISPPSRAVIDAYEEWQNAGVKSPMGQLLGKRAPSSVIVRGLDLSPSLKSQRYQFRQDVITSLENGHPETARELLKQARSKGIVFGSKDMQSIKSTARHYLKTQKLYEREPSRTLQ